MYQYQVKVDHKGHVIEMRGKVPTLYIDGKAIELCGDAHPFLSNKQLICRIYDAILDAIRATPKNTYKSLSFAEMIPQVEHAIAVRNFARKLRGMNLDYGWSKTEEDVNNQTRELVAATMNDIRWARARNLSDPERWVIHDLSCGYAGQELNVSDFHNLYDPIKDDDSELKAKVKEFGNFPFGDYLESQTCQQIENVVKEYAEETRGHIEAFRKMRAIAGDDVVNWGDHKYASQRKRAGVSDSRRAQSWLLHDVKNHMLAKGVKPAEKKESSIEKTKEMFNKFPGAVSQESLVRLFKHGAESSVRNYVEYMTAATAVSLLSMQTKNVYDKLTGKTLVVIGERVATGYNPEEFRKFLDFCIENERVDTCTFPMFDKHIGCFTADEFIRFARTRSSFGEDSEISPAFYSRVLTSIPAGAARWSVHAQVTDAFLRNGASVQDKIELLRAYKNRDTASSDHARLDFNLSQDMLRDVPWSELRESLYCQKYNGEDAANPACEYYLDLIMANKDTKLARMVLTDLNGDRNEDLFSLFGFEDKCEILKNYSHYRTPNLKKIFDDAELKNFQHVAMTDGDLARYVNSIPLAGINESLLVADVSSRLNGGNLAIELSDKLIRALNKESVKRVITRGQITDGESLKTALYAKLTRDELIETIQMPIPNHPDYMHMVGHMTDDERVTCARKHKKFFCAHLDRLPESFIAEYADKAKFKAAVGDRRSSANDRFGQALEARLAKISEKRQKSSKVAA